MLDLAVAVLAFIVVVFALQDWLIFARPTRIRALPPGQFHGTYRVLDIPLQRPDGALLEGFRSEPIDPAPAAARVLIYFGGRRENVAWAPHMATNLLGWNVYAFNYRGFGRSTSLPSESWSKMDAIAIYEHVRRMHPGGIEVLAVAGRSLGTAVALWLVRSRPVDRLVLFSPFPSLPSVISARRLTAPLARLLRYDLDSTHHAPHVRCPTLVLLAGTDTMVPHAQSRYLAALLASNPEIHVCKNETHASLPRSAAAQSHLSCFLATSATQHDLHTCASPPSPAPGLLP